MSAPGEAAAARTAESIEAWALAYVAADTWEAKLAPPPLPEAFAPGFEAVRVARPGRGPGFELAAHGEKSTGKSALSSEARRVRLMHTFLHHELQAAELFAWALCAFPDAPERLRRGLVGVLQDELRHMELYRGWLAERGVRPGDLPVRDWFWERVPQAVRIEQFLATMGLGFEGANLDHASRFAERFARAGDLRGAEIQRQVAAEEVPHVRFALTWFRALSPAIARGTPLFEAFAAALPAPLSPVLMKGPALALALRRRAGLDDAFLTALAAVPLVGAEAGPAASAPTRA